MTARGHKLVMTPKGNNRVSWTCECGKWKPRPASQAPWGPGPTSHDAVVNFIVNEHAKHANEFIGEAVEDQS